MKQNNTKYIMIAVLVVLVGVGGYLFSRVNSLSATSTDIGETKEFNLVLKDRKYTPDTINVKLGDNVVLNIDNQDNETHGLNLPEFGVAEFMSPLQKGSYSFKATKTGQLATTCSNTHPEKVNIIITNS